LLADRVGYAFLGETGFRGAGELLVLGGSVTGCLRIPLALLEEAGARRAGELLFVRGLDARCSESTTSKQRHERDDQDLSHDDHPLCLDCTPRTRTPELRSKRTP